MSDRYKNEIEKILEGSPDLPDEPSIQDEAIESFYSGLCRLVLVTQTSLP